MGSCPFLGSVVKSLQDCKDLCVETPSCTALNYDKTTTTCVMRGCSLPVVPPVDDVDDYEGFWLSDIRGSIRLDTYVCCFLLAPSGALVFILVYYIHTYPLPSKAATLSDLSNLEESCLYTFIIHFHFHSVFYIRNRTRQYFCMNYIDNACMYKFLQDSTRFFTFL